LAEANQLHEESRTAANELQAGNLRGVDEIADAQVGQPKWIKFPRAALDDPRWFGLSNDAKATWVSILLIASENAGRLPDPPILFRRLQTLGNLFQAGKFDRVIHELNQCGFLKKTRPELQSYRVTEKKEEEKLSESVDSCGKEASLSLAQQTDLVVRAKRVIAAFDKLPRPQSLGVKAEQAKKPDDVPRQTLTYPEAIAAGFSVPLSRFDRH
jgi:hypothetical protein